MCKKTIRLIAVIVVALTLFTGIFTVSVCAADRTHIPFESYTYWNDYAIEGNRKSVYNRPIYMVDKTLDFIDMGLDSQLKEITDIYSDDNGYTYILDGGASRVIVLDKDYALINTFVNVSKEENELSFLNAKGIFVDKEGNIYIADTENARVLISNINGEFISEYVLPESRLIPTTFNYKPIKITKDSRGYMYVLSDGSYYGAILYSPDGDFLGFYGANSVKTSLGDALSNIIKQMFMSNEQRSKMETSLPYQFTDLCVDKTDFIYTATGNTQSKKSASTQTGQIRKLSPGGMDIIASDEMNYGDENFYNNSQDILGVDVDDEGYIYALDSTFGHVFLYDQYNNNLGVFGCGTRKGIQDGSFTNAIAITVNGTDVLVADATLNTVCVFKITKYGEKLKEAQSLVNEGDYTTAKPLWEELIKVDTQNQLIYVGLAKAYYEEGNYDKAMEYAKLGYDRETYALAFGLVRNDFLTEYFTLIVVIAVAIIIGIIIALRYKKKHNIKLLPSKVKIAISVLRHPGDIFAEIKLKGVGSYAVAVVILILYYISSILSVTHGGFCYTGVDTASFNALLTLLRSVGVVVLFTICYWAVSTLMHGKGKIGEIFITVCYSFQPMIIANITYVILTNIMLPSEIAFLNLFMTAMTLYSAFLLCVGLMKISDYEFSRFLGVVVLSVVGIVLVLYVGILVFLLLQLLWSFLKTIVLEIYKMITFGG